jgi:mannitol-specific phosphotransferase system IIBC component
MQQLDFIYVVLPLGCIVVLLVATVLLSESRKERQEKKIRRAVEKLSKEKEEKQHAFKTQQDELDKLKETKAIDSDTYQRLSKLMQMNEKNLEDTMNALIFAENMGKKSKPKKAAKVAPQIQI